MHTGKQKQMNASYQASLVNRHIRRFTGKMLPSVDGFPVDYRLLGLPATAFEHGILSDFTLSRC